MNEFCNGEWGTGSYFFTFCFILFIPLGRLSAVEEKQELSRSRYESGPFLRAVGLDEPDPSPCSTLEPWYIVQPEGLTRVSPSPSPPETFSCPSKWMWDPTVCQQLEKPHWRACEVQPGEGVLHGAENMGVKTSQKIGKDGK